MSRILSNLSIRRFASRLTYSEYGPPSEVIQLEQFDDPKLPPHGAKIVVKMLAAPVHPADVNTIQGRNCSIFFGELGMKPVTTWVYIGSDTMKPK